MQTSRTRRRERIAPWLLLAAVALGGIALYPDLALVWALVAAVPFVLIGVCRWLPGPPPLVVAGMVLGGIVIPVFGLLGVDWLWAHMGGPRLAPIPSVIAGAAIVGLAAFAYLQPWWVRRPTKRAGVASAGVAALLVLVPPLLFLGYGAIEGSEDALSAPAAVVSQLDVVVLSENGQSAEKIDAARTRGWQIRPWFGTVKGDEVRWGPDGPPPPAPPVGADRVILLLADGAPERLDDAADLRPAPREPGEVDRWLGLVDGLALEPAPTFALLKTTDDARLTRWQQALEPRGGGARSLQKLAGDRSLTDLALRFGVLADTSDADLALAAQHRPALFFDSGERYSTPLNVDRLLSSGKMRLCDRGQDVRTLCAEVHGSADLDNGADHLAFDPGDLDAERTDSTIYVHVTRSGNLHRNAVYLDYWWYLPDNPSGSGGGAFCGAGFVIAGVTCLDHQSDWEGVTVMLDGDSKSSSPTAVAYAQHEGVTRYTWKALQKRWDGGDRARFGKGIDTSKRPLVFVAQGTHASYPASCADHKCRIGPKRPFRENRHDGGRPWSGNQDRQCASICLAAVPTDRDGDPVQWNAFDGYWGTRSCALGVFCSSSQAPKAPAAHRRYAYPWCATETVAAGGSSTKEPCTGRIPAAAELERGETLLALGDSYSSGQGAGSYDPGTNGDGNTCFRSRRAWPQLLARKLGLVPLQSLACSGAVTRQVTQDDGSRKEPERRRSQIGRIGDADPDVVTMTIGGNDVGFAGVLKHCVFDDDCTERYRKPGGDLLDREIAGLAERLPGVYAAIRRAAPHARLIVAGYPRLFPEEPEGNCAAARRISPREAAYLNDRSRALNAAIAGAARESGADFVDVTEAFDGRELRCSGETYLNRLRLREKLFPASFHPNAAGQERLAEVIKTEVG